jgi:dTDP-4-amino-4,6-dideoxygalactose transaminase
MKVPLLDLKKQFALIKKEILHEIELLCDTQQFILGEAVRRFEQHIEAFTGSQNAIACASGSDALLLALMTLGLEPGDEVVTTPFTFFATVGSIVRLGGVPVFVDIDPSTFTMDPNQIASRVSRRTRAIIPVHLFGQVAPMDPILMIAKAHDLVVIEDACQAIGSLYKGKQAGTLGDLGCFSFFPSKNLGGFGDGGMVLTDSTEWAKKIRLLRVHGEHQRYHHKWVGLNSRLDAIQAVVLSRKLPYLDQWNQARKRNAQYYDEAFANGPVISPKIIPECSSTYNQYVIRCDERDALQAYLEERGIGTAIYYPIPLHVQECFSYLGYHPGDFPESEKASQEALAIPVYPELTQEQKEYVVDSILSFYREGG